MFERSLPPVLLLLAQVPLPPLLLLAMVPNDSMNNPLCHSAIGSMVTFDYCTPDTKESEEMGYRETKARQC